MNLSPALDQIFETRSFKCSIYKIKIWWTLYPRRYIQSLKFIVDCLFAVGLIDRVVKNTCTEKYPIQHNYLPNDIKRRRLFQFKHYLYRFWLFISCRCLRLKVYSIWLADLIGVSSSNKSVHGLCALPFFSHFINHWKKTWKTLRVTFSEYIYRTAVHWNYTQYIYRYMKHANFNKHAHTYTCTVK